MSGSEHRVPQGSARARVDARRRKRRRALPVRPLLVVGGLLALVALIAAALLLRRADQTLATIQQSDPRRPTDSAGRVVPAGTPVSSGNLTAPVNLLLIGVDKRPTPDEGVRSDTLILARIDPQGQWASMLSIPRDSIVQIPHLGQSKINAAYAHGYAHAQEIYGAGTEPDAAGAALAAETVEGFLGVQIDYTAQVDFGGFEQLVDAVGGVLVDVERPLFDAEYPTDDYGVERIHIPAGLQTLSGRQALIYARSRHSSNDFDRSRRQQQVLRALLEQARARGLLENAALLPELAELVARNVRTTLPVRDLTMLNDLAALGRQLDGGRIVQLSINPNDVGIDAEDGSDLYWNKGDLAALVARWQAGPRAAAEQARIQVLNGAAVEGIAGRVSSYLQARGFSLADPGNVPAVAPTTTIIDYTGRPQTRQRLADLLGVDPRSVQSRPAPDAPPPPYGVDLVVIVGQDYAGLTIEQ
ncbi:MAG TPA: LCP family protein [Roseiflexaceae bacterium]|nr:LCP family protein [Roseiflexaceae bacterium]